MSISKRVLFSFLGIELLIFVIIFLGINFYIGTYYYGSKMESMTEIINTIELAYETSASPIELKLNLEYISYLFGGEITIYEEAVTMDMLTENGFFFQKGVIVEEIKHQGMTAFICENKMGGEQGLWMMYGRQLNTGFVTVLGIPVESIDNTVLVVKEFLLVVCFVAMTIGSIFAIFLARSMSKPITRLNDIAKEMGKMNFKIKYMDHRKDEIGELGRTLNNLTGELQETIENLKHELSKEKYLDVLRKRFVGQVSHELQTPVSVINGYIEALSDGVVDSEAERQEYYGIIEDEAAKMSKMIRELLDLSQLESGSFHMNKEVFDMNMLLDNLDHTHRFIADKEGIDWRYEPLKDPFMVYGDEGRLEQGIRNIIHNAFKHTKKNGYILIKASNELGTDKLKIRIANNGEHIPEEQLSFIWESFYKGKTSDKKQGTGLGLAIAANIFKHHQMSYKACNTDEGVCFELVISKYLQA